MFFDPDFSPFVVQCDICGDQLSFRDRRESGLCDDCEFDSLTPPLWPELLLAAMEHWKKDMAS